MSNILLVDDDEEARATLRALLELRGFGVVEAPNGQSALNHLVSADTQPSLVILDLEMPVMSGVELIDLMKRYHRLSRIPLVILSGSSKPALPRHQAIVANFVKPCDLEVLLEIATSFCKK